MSDNTEDWIEAGSSSQDGEVWRPLNIGEFILGEFVEAKHDVGPKNSMLYKIQTVDKDEPTALWGSTTLDDKMAEVPLKSQIKITYKGKERGKSGNAYHVWEVKYKAPENWAGDAKERLDNAS